VPEHQMYMNVFQILRASLSEEKNIYKCTYV